MGRPKGSQNKSGRNAGLVSGGRFRSERKARGEYDEKKPLVNLEDAVTAKNMKDYVRENVFVDAEGRREMVQSILSAMPTNDLRSIAVMLRRIEDGQVDDREMEEWLLRWKRKEMIYLAISGDEQTRVKLFTIPVKSLMADGSIDEDAEVMPVSELVSRLKQRTADLCRISAGGFDEEEEKPEEKPKVEVKKKEPVMVRMKAGTVEPGVKVGKEGGSVVGDGERKVEPPKENGSTDTKPKEYRVADKPKFKSKLKSRVRGLGY